MKWPCRSSQYRCGSCADDERWKKKCYCFQFPLLQMWSFPFYSSHGEPQPHLNLGALMLVIFYLVCPHALVPGHNKPPLPLADVCSDWMEAVVWWQDRQLVWGWHVTVGSYAAPFLKVYFVAEEWERFGVGEEGESVNEKESRSHGRARGRETRVVLVIASWCSAVLVR